MSLVVVPVRYPLSKHSRRTLERAIEVAREREAALTVLHVDLYQNGKKVTRLDLKTPSRAYGRLENTRYVVRTGFLVEGEHPRRSRGRQSRRRRHRGAKQATSGSDASSSALRTTPISIDISGAISTVKSLRSKSASA